MKKIFLLPVVVAIGLTSCHKLNNYKPADAIDGNTAITDAVSARAAITGLYGSLQDGGNAANIDFTFEGWTGMPACFAGESSFTGTFSQHREFAQLQISPANLSNEGIYGGYYYVIKNANDVIDRIGKLDTTAINNNAKLSYLAEARFIRGFCYFYLVNYYGNVPLVTDATHSDNLQTLGSIGNTDKQTVWNQIDSDVQYAMDHYSNNAWNGSASRISSYAIEAFMARVKLYRQDWQAALALAQNVATASPFALDANYDNIFGTAGKTSTENIWYLDYSSSDQNNSAFYYSPAAIGGRYELGVLNPDMFEAGDARKDASIATVDGANYFVYKYRDFSNKTDPIILLRMGEVYLIAAEAAAHMGDYATAGQYVNAIRERAGLADTTLDATNYTDIILQERASELCWEGPHRLFDLRRTGRAATVLAPLGYITPKCDLWPFPQHDIDANANLHQNPGY